MAWAMAWCALFGTYLSPQRTQKSSNPVIYVPHTQQFPECQTQCANKS